MKLIDLVGKKVKLQRTLFIKNKEYFFTELFNVKSANKQSYVLELESGELVNYIGRKEDFFLDFSVINEETLV